MLIYLIRHGETVSNQEGRFQVPHTPLAPEGEIQAGKVAERLQNIDIQEIWTSPMRRAQHTAEIINQYHQVPIVEKTQLREVKRATSLEGKLRKDPDLQHLTEFTWEHSFDPFFKFEDMETFAELVARSREMLQDLEQHSQEKPKNWTIALTTPGITLSTILLCVLLGPEASPNQIRSSISRMKITNTGISVVQVFEGKWQLFTLNDFAHL